jgi:chromosome segregation ATPase
MDEKKNLRQIENQVKEIKEKLWKVEKNLNLPTDDLYLYRLLKSLEERINVIETVLKIGDYADE